MYVCVAGVQVLDGLCMYVLLEWMYCIDALAEGVMVFCVVF